MDIIELNLIEEEIKKIKKDFNNGQVYTDGCFCGHALSKFRDNLYVLVNFSCRKSMMCDSSYYQVTSINVVEQASKLYDKETLNDLLSIINNDEIDVDIDKIDDREFMLGNGYYDSATYEDIYLYCEGFKFSPESLKAIQKKLFKYYKKSYGEWTEAKFKDVGYFNY